ncbi:MAG: alpha/beta fold hydrolase [Flavobacteriales bacterium]
MKRNYFLLTIVLTIILNTTYSQIQGTWHSNFQVAGKSLLMDLEIKGIGRDGSITISIPDQPKMKPQTMEDFALFSDSLWFSWKMIGLTYSGKLQGDSLVGKMSQSGLTWDAIFHKTIQEQKAATGKFQDPQAPFPYVSQELLVKTAKKIQIAGTLIMPVFEKNISFPLVILVSGSGAQDRNCEILGHRPFWVLADDLGRNQIASFRYDDRGVGKSSGKFQEATQTDFANDLLAIVHHLKKEFPLAKIYVYGHSEGGMTALRAAVQTKDINGIIEAASVGNSGKEVLIEQQYLIPKASGLGEDESRWNQRLYQEGAEIALNSTENDFSKKYKLWLSSCWDSIPSKMLDGASKEDVTEQMSAFFNNAWAREFLSFQSSTYLAQLDLPFLVINGTKDIQVPALSNQTDFRNNMTKASLEKSTFYLLEGANHLFQQCKSCDFSEYATLDQTLDPLVMQWVSEWILEQQKDHQ